MRLLIFILTCLHINIALAQKSQNEEIKNLVSDNYTIYKVVEKSSGRLFFEKQTKKWPVQVTIEDNRISKVMVKRAGIIDETFLPDLLTYPSSFKFQTYRVCYLKGVLYYFKLTSKNEAKIKYALVNSSKVLSGRIDNSKSELEKYMLATIKAQSGAKQELKDQKSAQIEAERKANSLQEKDPISIHVELIDLPFELGMGSIIKYGIIAKLENGTILKTPNLGGKLPWSDFKISAEGSTNTIEEIMVFEDGMLIPDDQVKVNVQSIYHPTIECSKSIDLKYNTDYIVSYPGGIGKYGLNPGLACDDCSRNGGNGSRGYDGASLTINVYAVSNPHNGVTYNKIEIIDDYSNKTLNRLKINAFSSLTINNYGGRGGDGGSGNASGYASADGGNGGDGGDGGAIRIIKGNTGVFTYNINNHGGRGGSGGNGDGNYPNTGSSGSSGTSGSVIEFEGLTNINW